MALSDNIIGFPSREEPKGPPMGYYEIKTKAIPDGRIHYGYLVVMSSWIGIADDDSNLTYVTPLDQLVEVSRKSLDTGEGIIH